MIVAVSLSDIKYDWALAHNKLYKVNAQVYSHIYKMLAGVPFNTMVTTTNMQRHGELNKKALEPGKYVWYENKWPIRMQKIRHCLNWQKVKSYVFGVGLRW